MKNTKYPTCNFQEYDKEEIEFMNAQSKGLIGNRILRAVVYLAKGNFDDFRYFAEKARTEFNEVLRQAEYDENGHKVYDFNKSFHQLIRHVIVFRQ